VRINKSALATNTNSKRGGQKYQNKGTQLDSMPHNKLKRYTNNFKTEKWKGMIEMQGESGSHKSGIDMGEDSSKTAKIKD